MYLIAKNHDRFSLWVNNIYERMVREDPTWGLDFSVVFGLKRSVPERKVSHTPTLTYW